MHLTGITLPKEGDLLCDWDTKPEPSQWENVFRINYTSARQPTLACCPMASGNLSCHDLGTMNEHLYSRHFIP
jgi:hypothetical protein